MSKPILKIARADLLDDNAQWENRFHVRSASSSRKYVVSQNKSKRHWGCSCRGWTIHRKCKHLTALALPPYEQPHEVALQAALAVLVLAGGQVDDAVGQARLGRVLVGLAAAENQEGGHAGDG